MVPSKICLVDSNFHVANDIIMVHYSSYINRAVITVL